MNKQILEWPNPALREKCKDAVIGSAELSKVLEDLVDTFSIVEGYGLAAPQIGHSLRALVVNPRALGMKDTEKDFLVMVNPIVEKVGAEVISNEACFSVPDISLSVSRHNACNVSYVNEGGIQQVASFEGLPAFCVQHEVDHLDGITMFDREFKQVPIKRESKKIGRNEKVMITKGSESKTLKYKKAEPMLEDGWVLSN